MLAEAQDVETPTEGAPKKTSHLRVRTDLHEEYSPEEIAKMTELYEGTLSNIEEGEIVKSRVLRVTDTAVILDVGFKSEGAVSVTRSTRDLTISPSSIFESVPSYSRVILAISSLEYSSSRPERTRNGERGGFLVGTSSSESSTSRASTSMRYTGSVVGLRMSPPIFTP